MCLWRRTCLLHTIGSISIWRNGIWSNHILQTPCFKTGHKAGTIVLSNTLLAANPDYFQDQQFNALGGLDPAVGMQSGYHKPLISLSLSSTSVQLNSLISCVLDYKVLLIYTSSHFLNFRTCLIFWDPPPPNLGDSTYYCNCFYHQQKSKVHR